MSNPATFEHYAHYPVCGYCINAWDIVYQRMRMSTSPAQWVDYCKVFGCDPDIWDYLDPETGWPRDWPMVGEPEVPKWSNLPIPPDPDNRVYHKRDNDGQNAPWRKVGRALTNKAIEARADFNMIDPVDRAEWDDDEDNVVELLVADLSDADLWE
jgi:hypothetical protein